MIDVTCFAGPGPLVPPHLSTPSSVERLLRLEGVTRAGVSPMEGLFTSDPGFNDDLMTLPKFFAPIPVVDPRWPNLAAHLRIYRGQGCVAVRITPGTHGYLAEEAAELKRMCGTLSLALILQMRVADPRNLPPDLPLPDVPLPDAMALAQAAPDTRMIVAGARIPELTTLLSTTQVFTDISLAEQPDILTRAVATHGPDRLLIGTHTPFLTPSAARQKLLSAKLKPTETEAVSWQNAEGLGFKAW